MQELGIGCRVDLKAATEYYKRAANAGEPNAQLKLARLFLTKFDPISLQQHQNPDFSVTLSGSIILSDN